MNIRLMLAAGLALIAFAPSRSSADDRSERTSDKRENRLARKCAHEAEKDWRDSQRERRHPRRDNKWDELCAVAPPVVQPPVIPPPVIVPPPLDLPPGVTPPLLPPPP